MTPPCRSHPDLGLVGQAAVVDVAHETARAVAALLHFAPVGIEDAVVKVGVRLAGRLDLKDLVAADPEMPVCEAS